MKTIIKSILIAFTLVCAINCSNELPNHEEPFNQVHAPDDISNYNLKQKHLETVHKIEYYLWSDKEDHKIVDVNKVWLEFSNGYCSNAVYFEIVYTPVYNGQIKHENITSLLNTTVYYNNGFKIGDDIIECSFTPEKTDNLVFHIGEQTVEILFPELLFCPITPISLKINSVDTNYVYTTLSIEIYHPDNLLVINSSGQAVPSNETMEIPLNIKI